MFITAQILSSLDPLGTDEGRECVAMQISVTRLLISTTVGMFETLEIRGVRGVTILKGSKHTVTDEVNRARRDVTRAGIARKLGHERSQVCDVLES
jgi:hypothetical protein